MDAYTTYPTNKSFKISGVIHTQTLADDRICIGFLSSVVTDFLPSVSEVGLFGGDHDGSKGVLSDVDVDSSFDGFRC